jgi:hypothetical protein
LTKVEPPAWRVSGTIVWLVAVDVMPVVLVVLELEVLDVVEVLGVVVLPPEKYR